MFNDRWWFDRYNLEGLKTYINDLTFGANVLLGMQKYKLNSLPEQKYEYDVINYLFFDLNCN